MSPPTIIPVATRRQRKQFLALPWKLHGDDPNWVPPLRVNQEELTGFRRHPFCEKNEVRTFLAYRGGEVCGRVAAILNRAHNARYGERRGFFGFFESIDDQQVADGLLGAVADWFAERGIQQLRGPVNPSLNYELGLLVEGFDSPPTFMMTYNPPYYARLIEGFGLRKVQDLYAYWGHAEMLPQITAKLNPVAEQIIERYDVKLRTIDTRRFRRDVEAFLSVYNRSLAGTWGFVPMTPAEVRHVARGLKHLLVPELTCAAEIDGRMVGAAFGLLDYNPRIKRIDGRLFPFGFLRLLSNRRAIRRLRFISANVIPEYQRLGVGLALIYGIGQRVLKWQPEEAEFSWVLESNRLSRRSLEKAGTRRVKTYRLYDWESPAAGCAERAA